jgi:hypothetical protein
MILTLCLLKMAAVGNASRPLAIRHDEQVVDSLEEACVTPHAEPAEDCTLERQVLSQKPPSNPAAQDVIIAFRISRVGQRRGRPRA